MTFPFPLPEFIYPGPNVRVTFDNSPQNDRSESALVVNPFNPQNMVGASKRFTNPPAYQFSIAAVVTNDAGQNWVDAAPLQLLSGWGGTSDPALAFDAAGNVHLLALPFDNSGNLNTLGVAAYASSDGGMTWNAPNVIHSSPDDDKQTAASDLHPLSPFFGQVYAAWDDGSTLRFARTNDGVTWRGVGNNPAGVGLEAVQDSFSPDIAVARNGDVYIVWITGETGTSLKFVKSTDGGNTFSGAQVLASGITPLTAPPLNEPGAFPEFPGGKFRVLSIPAACATDDKTVIVAWADLREKDQSGTARSRIYFQRTSDGGQTWGLSPSGQPLIRDRFPFFPIFQWHHDFHPQLVGTPDGRVGCALYRFANGPLLTFPLVSPPRISVVFALSFNDGQSFTHGTIVTDRPWDPAIDAPLSHGDPNTTFIGDYFGLAVSPFGYFPFWTDTRTGMQELFTSRVRVSREIVVEPGLVNFLIGSLGDGPLWRLTPHGIVPVPPWGPEIRDREAYAERTRTAIAEISRGLETLQGLNEEFEGKLQQGRGARAAGGG